MPYYTESSDHPYNPCSMLANLIIPLLTIVCIVSILSTSTTLVPLYKLSQI